jgi:hypothetical protein
MNDTNDDASDDSDEWGMEELVIPSKGVPSDEGTGGNDADTDANDDGDEWAARLQPATNQQNESETALKAAQEEGNPMIIVDITQIDPNIHSKFDRNSVNDSLAASTLRKMIETNYGKYAKDVNLLATGTVIPCGSSVWRGALTRLRDERPGHYFAPIFPPKQKS